MSSDITSQEVIDIVTLVMRRNSLFFMHYSQGYYKAMKDSTLEYYHIYNTSDLGWIVEFQIIN